MLKNAPLQGVSSSDNPKNRSSLASFFHFSGFWAKAICRWSMVYVCSEIREQF
jgi:hypothetical protein